MRPAASGLNSDKTRAHSGKRYVMKSEEILPVSRHMRLADLDRSRSAEEGVAIANPSFRHTPFDLERFNGGGGFWNSIGLFSSPGLLTDISSSSRNQMRL